MVGEVENQSRDAENQQQNFEERIRFDDIINDLSSVDQVINSDEIKASLKLVPENYFRNAAKNYRIEEEKIEDFISELLALGIKNAARNESVVNERYDANIRQSDNIEK